jgi:hypothetical protein
MLVDKGWYDEVHHALLEGWIEAVRGHYDLAVFGDVLEHLRPRQIHRVIRRGLRTFDRLVIVVPLCDLFQGESYGNPLEVHRTYITEAFFDRYHPVEKHIYRGAKWTIMNVCLLANRPRARLCRRLAWYTFDRCVVLLQPFGLARPFATVIRKCFRRYKSILCDE